MNVARLCVALLFVMVPAGCLREKHPMPTDYEIPSGASGWVTVRFADSSAPPIPVEGGHRVLRIPANLQLAVSSPQELGVVHQSFYFVDGRGRKTPIEDVSRKAEIGSRAPSMTFPEPVVCCVHVGNAMKDGRRSVFEAFYVGRGPAGQPPDWPE